jgi:hypothetical protein
MNVPRSAAATVLALALAGCASHAPAPVPASTPTATVTVSAADARLCAALRAAADPETAYTSAVIAETSRLAHGGYASDAVTRRAVGNVDASVRRGCPGFASRSAGWGRGMLSS